MSLILLVAVPAVSLLAEAPPPQAPRPLVWCTNPLYPPYDWATGPEAYDGAAVELLARLLPPGLPASPLVVPWARAQAMAAEGRVDLLMAIRITPERSQYLEFTSVPVFQNPIVIWARRDRPWTFASWADLKGHRGGVSRGDYFGGGFDSYLRSDLSYEEAASMRENFVKLALGRIEWFVSGYYLGLSWLKSNPEGQEIVALEPQVSNEGIYLGISKKSPWLHLLPSINERLKALQSEGLPARLLGDYLKKYLSAPDKVYTP